MVNLTDADIARFQTLVSKETGKRISKEEAREQATNLIELVAFVLRPGKDPLTSDL